MFILQIGGWFIFSCILMSFIEHQIHRKLMHRKNFEPPRVSWRLHSLRGWSDDKTQPVPAGVARASGADGDGAPGGAPLGVGGDELDRQQVRDDAGNAAPLGAPGGGQWRDAPRGDERGEGATAPARTGES